MDIGTDQVKHINKIGQIYREILQEANRPFKLTFIGRNGVGKSGVAAWLFMGNPNIDIAALDFVDIIDISSSHDVVAAAPAKAVNSDLTIFVVDASKKPTKAELAVWQSLKTLNSPLLLVANKIDLVENRADVETALMVQFNTGPKHFAAVSAKKGINIERGLIQRIAYLAKDIEAPLGRRCPIMRRALANRIINKTAAENTVIGVMVILPGADLPIMTANQVRMIMRLAILYGQDLGAERLKELVVVLGSAFAFRTIAREAADFIPVLGWAIKGGIAYSGTIALGKAAIKYFERTEVLSGHEVEIEPDGAALLRIAGAK